jgi:hypothetical protein
MTDQTPINGFSKVQNPLSVTDSRCSMPSLTKPSAAQMDTARKAAKKILSAYPDYGKAPPEYIVNFAEALSYLSEAEIAAVTDPRNGVASRCQYLPTIADIHALLRERRERAEQFKPAPTAYHRLKDETGPWDRETDFERKARVVKELLGYNPGPSARKTESKRDLVPPAAEDLANLKLKTPPAPPSPYLINLLKQQGYQFDAGKDQEQAA